MGTPDISAEQEAICRRYGATFAPPTNDMKVGIARNVLDHLLPLNGLRHSPVGDTSGWYIWAGEGNPGDDPEFFVPLHIAHLGEWCPAVVQFLALPPGWRFLLADDQEDVWEDSKLLEV